MARCRESSKTHNKKVNRRAQANATKGTLPSTELQRQCRGGEIKLGSIKDITLPRSSSANTTVLVVKNVFLFTS